ncbi:MAG TPA: serine/threonine-protein kinase, partial [Kofleriaceae bacterium]|nr:serine/threonine-protein kinase [Kofleriaceae bacterium]
MREPLASGGFGMVFRAEQPALGREAVIKILHRRLLASETMVQRFLLEARLASRLDHPYAAHTYAFGAEPDGVLWIAMELVRGTPLDRLLEAQGPMPPERLAGLIERLCEVVHSAHEQGIVHRDLKPANVMVLSRAGRLLPKLLDLGIARFAGALPPLAGPPGGAVRPGAGAGSDTGAATLVRSAGATGEELAETIAVERAPAPATEVSGPAMSSGATEVSGPAASSSAAEEPGAAIAPGAGGDRGAGGARAAATDETRWSAPAPPSGALAAGSPLPADGSSDRLTAQGSTMGSPHYMAPEQWRDAASADRRTDIYALGAVCYEALTGRPPFEAATTAQLALAHANLAPPPLGGGLPAALDEVIARAMAKRPEDRYQTALELAGDLRAACGLGDEPPALPALDDELHARALAAAPQPLAHAAAALAAARNPHQARDAAWLLARVAVRLLAAVALAGHSQVGAGAATADSAGALRRLREEQPIDEAWLDIARELARAFDRLRDAYPVPELIAHLLDGGDAPLRELLALRRAPGAAGGGEEQVRGLLERAVPLCGRVIASLEFLSAYRLVVPDEASGGDVAEVWMGLGARRRPEVLVRGRELRPGCPALLDATGVPVLDLWPFVQALPPAPGAPRALFLFDGRGARGARLAALPDPFEREDEDLWERLGGLLADDPDPAAGEERCPFPGLATYTAEDAGHFTGREREVEAMVNRLRVQGLLAVVGPSGAGKSSFVQAGVIPALPDSWRAAVVRPGPAPLAGLAARLGALGWIEEDLGARLAAEPAALGEALRAAARAAGHTLVLVVDQLEELFTLSGEAGERERYGAALAGAARSADDPVRVIVTLRDDFLLRAEALPPLTARLGQGLQLLTTPAAPQLRRILVEPLRRAGYGFDDPDLPDEMVAEVAGEPGALALLSFTARRLWELRDRRFRQLARKAYTSLGGVGGALAQHAEATLEAMPPEERRLVRLVFRHAVTAAGTRAVLAREELEQLLGGGRHAASVIEKLVAARLLVASDDEGGHRIEIAHEALLGAWPRLVGWRREDAEGARLRDQLRAAARQWEERGRPSGLLWRGDALAEARLWLDRHPGQLTGSEEAFAAASLAEAARSRRLRRGLLAGAFAALAAVAVVLLVLNARATEARHLAQRRGDEAERNARKLSALLLGQYQSQGRRLVLADEPLQGLAYLARAAAEGARGPAHDFMVAQAIRATSGEIFVLESELSVQRVRFSPDGTRLVSTGYADQALLWDTASGARVAPLPHGAAVRRADVSPDGALVVTGADDGTVSLWRAADGAPVASWSTEQGPPQEVVASPAGDQLLVVGADDSAALWHLPSGRRIALLHPPSDTGSGILVGRPAAFSPDGARVAAGDGAGTVRVWDARRGGLI